MEYKILKSNNSNELEKKVNELLELGWQPLGSHIISIIGKEIQTREYSQTMIKN